MATSHAAMAGTPLTGSKPPTLTRAGIQSLDRNDGVLDHGEPEPFPFRLKAGAYDDSCPARPTPGCAFFGLSALRFIVAVIAPLAIVPVPDLGGLAGAFARSLGGE
jgi:hypothetical protein